MTDTHQRTLVEMVEEAQARKETRLRDALASWWALSNAEPLETFRLALGEIKSAEKALTQERGEEILTQAFSTYRLGEEPAR